MPVSAATGVQITGESSVTIMREVSGVSNPVTATFSYAMVPDDNNPASIEGLDTVGVTMNAVVPNSDGQARIEQSIDLSNLTFTKVGDYKIHVHEVYSSNSKNYPVDELDSYKILISVRNVTENGVPTGELIATLVNQVEGSSGDKYGAMAFTSEANRTSITLTKSLSGNAADTDEYFKFRIDFENATVGDVFTIFGQDSVVTYHGETIVTQTQYVVGQDNYVYLKGDQTVEIGSDGEFKLELPIGLRYTITELDAQDYQTYIDSSTAEGKISPRKTTAAMITDTRDITSDDPDVQNKTYFENVKNTTVMTGISAVILPFVGLALIGITSTCAYIAISRKK